MKTDELQATKATRMHRRF